MRNDRFENFNRHRDIPAVASMLLLYSSSYAGKSVTA